MNAPLTASATRVQAVAADQDRVVLDVCNANAMEISQCIGELQGMAGATRKLHGLLEGENAALQVPSGPRMSVFTLNCLIAATTASPPLAHRNHTEIPDLIGLVRLISPLPAGRRFCPDVQRNLAE